MYQKRIYWRLYRRYKTCKTLLTNKIRWKYTKGSIRYISLCYKQCEIQVASPKSRIIWLNKQSNRVVGLEYLINCSIVCCQLKSSPLLSLTHKLRLPQSFCISLTYFGFFQPLLIDTNVFACCQVQIHLTRWIPREVHSGWYEFTVDNGRSIRTDHLSRWKLGTWFFIETSN